MGKLRTEQHDEQTHWRAMRLLFGGACPHSDNHASAKGLYQALLDMCPTGY